MQYVFLDLEWNNAYSKKHERFINEIIEIGAVKLDENLSEIGRFDSIIHSQITKKLDRRFRKLTDITNEDMLGGISFEKAISDFKDFCGEDYVVITWSNSDLYAIIDNFKAFLPEAEIDFIGNYLDMQKFYQSIYPAKENQQIALKDAAENVKIPLDDIKLHRASDDSALTAEIFRRIYNKGNLKGFITDTNQNNFFDRLRFRPYLIDDIKSEFIKKSDLIFYCSECGARGKKSKNWTVKNKQFYNEFFCPKCKKKFVGRLCVKKYYDYTKVKKTVLNLKPKHKEKVK